MDHRWLMGDVNWLDELLFELLGITLLSTHGQCVLCLTHALAGRHLRGEKKGKGKGALEA